MISRLQHARLAYQPKLPAVFREHGAGAASRDGDVHAPAHDGERIRGFFPNVYRLPMVSFDDDVCAPPVTQDPICVGVIFSGGQAPGGHNVVAGLVDGLKSLHPDNRLIGFLGGPGGLLRNDVVELTPEHIGPYRNTGGFDLIRSDRTKLESEEQFEAVRKHCNARGISALVIIGGDDSNTNACYLAEYFIRSNAGIQVIGCPKTIDGDLKNEWIESSFGFDTACKVYSELVGNIYRDALSAGKYWHFIRIMGRSASHIALECALQTHPNITLISEEVAHDNLTLLDITDRIAAVICERAAAGRNYGLLLVPEGLIEFIPEMRVLISELNDLLANDASLQRTLASAPDEAALTACGLTAASAAAYKSLPAEIRSQLVMDRDPHGNVQVSKIETEKLLIRKVAERLRERRAAGEYLGAFSAQNHFFGYEGRCAAPSNFDADYCYSLGYTGAALIGAGKTGCIAAIRNLHKPAEDWQPFGVPVTSMMNIERRGGKEKPVIKKALVDLHQPPFCELAAHRAEWAVADEFVSPGPIQYFGPGTITDLPPLTLLLEKGVSINGDIG